MDTVTLEKLMEKGEFEDARKLLENYFKKPVSNEERGAAYFNLANMYMKVMNGVNEKYKSGLEEIILRLEQIEKAQKESLNLIDIARVKKELNG